MAIECDVNSLSSASSCLQGCLNIEQLDAIRTALLCKVLEGGGAGPGDETWRILTEDLNFIMTENLNFLNREH